MPRLRQFAKTGWLLARKTVQEYGDDACSHMAAAISYYVLFSIVPLAIFLIAIFGFVVGDDKRQEDVSADVVDFLNLEAGAPAFQLTNDARQQIEASAGEATVAEVEDELDALSSDEARRDEADVLANDLNSGRTVTVAGVSLTEGDVLTRSDNIVIDTIRGVSGVSGPLAIIGLVGMVWSSSAMFGAVRRSLNIAWDVDVHRPVAQQKLLDLGMVLGIGVLLGLSIAGTTALRTLRELSDDALGPLSTGTGFFWSVLPLFLPAVLSFVVFLLLYRLVPNVNVTVRDVLPGAILATVLFELFKNGFALYIANFNNYATAYGALGGILLFMLWTYLSANILLIGAEFASEYPRVMRGDYEGVSGPQRSVPEMILRTVRGFFVRVPDDPKPTERVDD